MNARQFSLRTLFLVVTLAGVAAWLVRIEPLVILWAIFASMALPYVFLPILMFADGRRDARGGDYGERPRSRHFAIPPWVLWAVVIVLGTCGGWLALQTNWIRDRHTAIRQASATQKIDTRSAWFFPAPAGDDSAPWRIRIFGERGIAKIVVSAPAPGLDARVKETKRLFPEAEVWGAPWGVATYEPPLEDFGDF